MNDETIPISGHCESKLNYGSNKNSNNDECDVYSRNKTTTHQPRPTTTYHSSSISTTIMRRHQQRQPHINQNQANLRFMVMLFTGVTFFICILFVFVQSALSVLHDRHHHASKQYHMEEILSDNSNNDMERFPSSSSSASSSSASLCCSGNSSSRCTFRQLGQIMVPSTYQSMIDTIQLHLFSSSGCNQTNNNDNSHHPDTAQKSMATCLQPPSNVNNIRKQILFVRDLLDIFSPIYCNSTTQQLNSPNEAAAVDEKESDDPWAVLRTELDVAYTLIGQYQDLDRSHVQYTVEEISILQYRILQWYNQFTTSSLVKYKTNAINDVDYSAKTKATATTSPSTRQYLWLMNDTITTTTTPTWYTHAAESRLFWKGMQYPALFVDHYNHKSQLLQQKQQQSSSIDSSATTIIQLLFMKQLQLAKKYYIKAYQHESVVQNDVEQIDYQ
jgi:hypothetical protein